MSDNPPASAAAPASERPRRRPGAGAIVAIVAGGVVSLALVFGGGMATAWAIGPGVHHVASAISRDLGHGGAPRFGEHRPHHEPALPGERSRGESGSSSSSSGG
jgi:hypothetical protein